MPGDANAADRGQTGLDFLVGMGVFLLTVGFVVGFVPGMFAPFTGGQEHPLVADRTVDTLARDALAGDRPSVLDEACTVAFFGVDNDATCPYDETVPVRDRLALPSAYDLNVTVERNVTGSADREVLCGTDDAVVTCSSTTTRLAAGESVPRGTSDVVTATRLVYAGTREVAVVVRVW